MTNPYESPKTVSPSERSPRDERPVQARKVDLRGFFAWYFGAFIIAQLLWYLSDFVARVDLLEISMATPFFPLASFFDPHDSMVNNRFVFFYALLFWGALIPISLRLAGKRLNPLIPAMVILLLTSLASVGYVFFVGFRTGPMP
jgi:hypothetical protein